MQAAHNINSGVSEVGAAIAKDDDSGVTIQIVHEAFFIVQQRLAVVSRTKANCIHDFWNRLFYLVFIENIAYRYQSVRKGEGLQLSYDLMH